MTFPRNIDANSFRQTLFGTALGIAALALAGPGLAQSSTQPGLYTSEQALRGEKAFLGNCVGCHGYSMSSIFSGYRNAYIYWGKISSTMPWEDAGHLAPQDYIDMVAYMMRENGFPPGEVELKVDRPLLESIIPPRAGMQ
jgi:mono/diheme cytochrome c family protein